MTHYKVEIQLPLLYNLKERERKRKSIPAYLFYETYIELFEMAKGIHTSSAPVLGAWECPKTGKKVYDSCIVFTVLIETKGEVDYTKIPLINALIKYKKVLLKRFEQDTIYMVATRCIWL